ncbi:hypothetical protein OS493_021135 [Desmophyllum pertusum]|uniref:Uncharacterized protein n=1 Tax=Desmophyllum pertusum TaxID=174260 RepID=A0A9X0D2T6_9CNID|nr:hypothetical protein OS493_021135 [Desmophyllum pertusum]
MADNLIEKETNWFSAELRILEAEFEKSKLQVYQDTLFCKRSMVELELLCKNEQLRKSVRVNNKLKEHDSQIQDQLETLSSELQNATSQLQTAQNTLQDEKAQHHLEKKELEDKLNSELERKMEEHITTASNRENVLQDEIRSWQDKHVQASREAEDLMTKLSKKNVAVKTKAVQAKVDVKNTSTMVQVDPQTCDVSVQVQDPTMAKDRSRMDDDDAREIDEDLRETNEISKGKKKVTEAIGKKSNKRMVKENKPRIDKHKSNEKGKKAKGCKGVNEGKEKENVAKAEFAGKKRKVSRKRKASQREDVASQSETTTPAEEQQTTTQVEKRQSSTLAEKQDEFHERANASKIWFIAPSASQEDDIPFQYSKTPGRLQKLEESGQSLEKHGDKSDASTQGPQDGTTASMEKTSPSNERCKVALKDLTPLAVFVEDIANKDFVLESKGEEKNRN